jgi:hypothetical protein
MHTEPKTGTEAVYAYLHARRMALVATGADRRVGDRIHQATTAGIALDIRLAVRRGNVAGLSENASIGWKASTGAVLRAFPALRCGYVD